MVAAFSCQAIGQYNKFVLAYRKDLQASDLALQRFFRRLYGQTGTADYHAFKTRLANTSSMDSIHDMRGFCATAQARFDAAFTASKTSLATFVAEQPLEVDREFAPCPSQPKSTPNRAQTAAASKPRSK
jgi:hypothetical protein